MIVVKLMGGLGNQMFQYATGRSLAEKHHTSLYLDKTWFDQTRAVATPRHYELDRFKLKAQFIDPGTYTILQNGDGIKKKLLLKARHAAKKGLLHYTEQGHGFNKAFNKLPDNTYLDGYWQTDKYFSDIKEVILKDFSFTLEPTGKNKTALKAINTVNAVSLHIRRGDYVSHKATSEFHGTVNLDYYEKAVGYIAKAVKNPHFFIFSDDPSWCKKNLKIDFPTIYVDHNKVGSEDMRLMIACQHHIVANSTFSWWGAWLNDSNDKIVIAPKHWFANTTMDTKDIIPKEWISL